MSPSIGIFFSDSVLENWSRWFDREQKLWSPQEIVCATSTLVLPRAMPALLDLNQLCPAAGSVEDCALSDLPDNVEFVTFSSGDYGEYSHLDRLNMVRLTLAEIEVQNAKACVLLNFACICKFEHTDRESGVAVGIVTNQHTSPTTGDFLYDKRFCPPKGAKLAAKNRTNTLYQNINANMAFEFDLHYKSKVRKKDMLAFYLHINKGAGKFSKSVSSQTFIACPLIPLLTM